MLSEQLVVGEGVHSEGEVVVEQLLAHVVPLRLVQQHPSVVALVLGVLLVQVRDLYLLSIWGLLNVQISSFDGLETERA